MIKSLFAETYLLYARIPNIIFYNSLCVKPVVILYYSSCPYKTTKTGNVGCLKYLLVFRLCKYKKDFDVSFLISMD